MHGVASFNVPATDSQAKSVCKLLKSFCGLKQASRQCNIKLTTPLVESGFTQSFLDYSLVIKHADGKKVFAMICVDDLLIT